MRLQGFAVYFSTCLVDMGRQRTSTWCKLHAPIRSSLPSTPASSLRSIFAPVEDEAFFIFRLLHYGSSKFTSSNTMETTRWQLEWVGTFIFIYVSKIILYSHVATLTLSLIKTWQLKNNPCIPLESPTNAFRWLRDCCGWRISVDEVIRGWVLQTNLIHLAIDWKIPPPPSPRTISNFEPS